MAIIGRFHAYGEGSIYRKTDIPGAVFFADVFQKIADKFRAQKVWSVFRKNCIMGKECYLGINAWCTNMIAKDSIVLGDRVYCRGVIRCGSRGRGRISIGNNVYIGDDTIISTESCIEIGDFTLISHGVHIFDTIGHPVDPLMRELDWCIVTRQIVGQERPPVASAAITIGKQVWIGFNSIIMKGVNIGDRAVVGAGSVVVDDVPSGAMVVGNPARILKL